MFANFFAPIALPSEHLEYNRPGCGLWTMLDYDAPEFAEHRADYEESLADENN